MFKLNITQSGQWDLEKSVSDRNSTIYEAPFGHVAVTDRAAGYGYNMYEVHHYSPDKGASAGLIGRFTVDHATGDVHSNYLASGKADRISHVHGLIQQHHNALGRPIKKP